MPLRALVHGLSLGIHTVNIDETMIQYWAAWSMLWAAWSLELHLLDMLVLEKVRVEEHPTCSFWHDENIATALQEIRNDDQTFRMRIRSRDELQTSLTKKQFIGATSTSVPEEASVASQEAKCEKWEARLKYVDVVLMRWPDAPVHPVSAPSSIGKGKITVVNSLTEQATNKGVVGEKVSTTKGKENPSQMQQERGKENINEEEECNEDKGGLRQENNNEDEEENEDKGGVREGEHQGRRRRQ
ncbi:hypothetical protein LINPERHAP2_LOCUS41047 [Linum perenne]